MAKEITVFYGDVMIKGPTKGVTDLLEKLAGREPKDDKDWTKKVGEPKDRRYYWSPEKGSGWDTRYNR